MTDMSTRVSELIAKAAECKDSGDAQRFSQAACNAANALHTVAYLNPENDLDAAIRSLASRMDRAGAKMTEYGSVCLSEAGKELCGWRGAK